MTRLGFSSGRQRGRNLIQRDWACLLAAHDASAYLTCADDSVDSKYKGRQTSGCEASTDLRKELRSNYEINKRLITQTLNTSLTKLEPENKST